MNNFISRGDVVRAPAPTDDIGGALRTVYANDPALPADLRMLLASMDRCRREP